MPTIFISNLRFTARFGLGPQRANNLGGRSKWQRQFRPHYFNHLELRCPLAGSECLRAQVHRDPCIPVPSCTLEQNSARGLRTPLLRRRATPVGVAHKRGFVHEWIVLPLPLDEPCSFCMSSSPRRNPCEKRSEIWPAQDESYLRFSRNLDAFRNTSHGTRLRNGLARFLWTDIAAMVNPAQTSASYGTTNVIALKAAIQALASQGA